MHSVEINTSQNVPIVYELGGVRDRSLAFLLDFVIILGSILIVQIFAMISSLPWDSKMWYAVYVLELLIFFFYTPSMEILFNGQTVGKMALKLKVVRLDGAEVKMSDYLTRWMFRMVDIYFSLGTVAAMLVSSTEKAQRIGDLLSHTTVVRLTPRIQIRFNDLLKIQSINDYAPRFPEVKNLSEEDVLTVKMVLERYNRFSNPSHANALNLAAKNIAAKLNLDPKGITSMDFLKTILKDFVVLTR
jgi:uncharacterized RDD family membrane protein YckC